MIVLLQEILIERKKKCAAEALRASSGNAYNTTHHETVLIVNDPVPPGLFHHVKNNFLFGDTVAECKHINEDSASQSDRTMTKRENFVGSPATNKTRNRVHGLPERCPLHGCFAPAGQSLSLPSMVVTTTVAHAQRIFAFPSWHINNGSHDDHYRSGNDSTVANRPMSVLQRMINSALLGVIALTMTAMIVAWFAVMITSNLQ